MQGSQASKIIKKIVLKNIPVFSTHISFGEMCNFVKCTLQIFIEKRNADFIVQVFEMQ